MDRLMVIVAIFGIVLLILAFIAIMALRYKKRDPFHVEEIRVKKAEAQRILHRSWDNKFIK